MRKRPDQNFPDFGRVFELFRGKDCPVLEGEEGEQVVSHKLDRRSIGPVCVSHLLLSVSDFKMTYRGQFAASKERILANSKEKYSQLYYWLSVSLDFEEEEEFASRAAIFSFSQLWSFELLYIHGNFQKPWFLFPFADSFF